MGARGDMQVGSSMLVDGLNLMQESSYLPVLLAEAGFFSAVTAKLWSLFQVALGLGFVIFVHELGHFLAAKTFGVRCDKFYIGFDVPISIGPIRFPTTLGKFTWGETEYGIGIIPLGGYVKMLGQDDDPRRQAEENEKIRRAAEEAGQEGASELSEEPELDPRSYPAKPVWQRMIIISAGVVMNLIFAVFLAGAAYRFGVPITPTVVGSTIGGGPGWQAGMQVGDQIVKYGDEQEDASQIRYRDFATEVLMRGFQGKKEFPVTLIRDGKRQELTTTPTADYSADRDAYRIGVGPPTTPKLGPSPVSKLSFLASKEPDLREGDRIVAVNGEALPVDDRYGAIIGSELTSRLQANFTEQVQVTIERPNGDSSSTVNVDLPPVPVKTLGIGFKPGPVVAVQANSPAEQAGVKVRDVIEKINGQPVVNALQLPAMVGRLAGEEIRLGIRRPTTHSVSEREQAAASGRQLDPDSEVEIVLAGPEQASFDPVAPYAGALTLGGLGIAVEISAEISHVDDTAAQSGFEVGDVLTQVHWVANDEEKKVTKGLFSKEAYKSQPIAEKRFNVASLFDFVQSVPVDATFKCYVSRAGTTRDGELKLHYADDWYWHVRGIGLSQLSDTMQTDQLGTALQLGFGETVRRFNDVLDFLKLLVTGKIGAKGIGGPIRIFDVAASEADEGVSRLLMFLTFLSANLAILNFLPIPALDGGHMVFLTAEAIRGKPVNEDLQIRLTMVGVLCLLGLMAFVIVKDIMSYM